MKHIRLDDVPLINSDKLDPELRAACPHYQGRSTGKGLVLHFDESATDEEMALAVQMARQHDPFELSEEQQRQKDRAEMRTKLLGELKKRKDDPLAKAVALLLEALG